VIDSLLILAIIIILFLAAVLGYGVIARSKSTAVTLNALPLLPSDNPLQSNVRNEQAAAISWEENGTTWTLQPRASYQIAARVLGNKQYTDWESDAAPLDLALGWGELSDPAVDKWINWRQARRWYFYNWNNDSPYDGRYISDHSANVHIIPATDNLDKILSRLDKNDVVYLEGRLVDLQASKGQQDRSIRTSLTRTDSGNGACEILYVERLIWDGQVYE
jgi:hypothetical protein